MVIIKIDRKHTTSFSKVELEKKRQKCENSIFEQSAWACPVQRRLGAALAHEQRQRSGAPTAGDRLQYPLMMSKHRLLSCVTEKTAVDTRVRRRACTQRLKTATSWPEARKEFDTFSANQPTNQPTGRHRQQHNSTYISQATRRSKQH
ncbi:hypothetical protein T07_10120 [Trichinella nelsoni]|uniref:Uncharacterized protein n=1 Tax=Trichinella nelsoni TaxID=6336 RepID=A0A0V0RG37_9BILA|nr:hypothetical protein T07_10120 [Trichinella nelsoni]